MGKRWKLYQTRRILAMILAVTMVVGMVPSTALAAPGDDGTQTVEDTAAAVQTTEETIDDASADADGGDAAAGTEETVTGDANTTTDTGEGADTGDTATIDMQTPAADGDSAATGTEGDAPAATEEPAPAAPQPFYMIYTDAMETKEQYTGSMPFDLSAIELWETPDPQVDYTEAWDAMDAGVTVSWKKQGADGAFVAMPTGTQPVDVGVYELTLTYAKVAGVHEGATATVTCEITKAPVTIRLGTYEDNKITVAPGTLKENVKLPAGEFRVYAAANGIGWEDIDLTIEGIRDAITNAAVQDGTKLVRNGDYVIDIKPSWKEATPSAKRQNYELPESFTADIVAADLIMTQVEVKLADKWKTEEEQAGVVVLKAYDEKQADAPKETDDYTYEVKYYDAAASEYKLLTDAKVTGEWAEYADCEYKDGKVQAPTDAGSYTYLLVYEDAEGVYGESYGEVPVEITPAMLTVEATNTAALNVLEGTTVQEILSGVTYKVTKTGATGTAENVTAKMKAGSVWGTGFDDSNVSQIYEPVFTLQESADGGKTYENIEDEAYQVVSDRKYRVIYDGKKAVYNADGSYAHRTDVNDSENINGYNSNYETDTTPTAADKALEVTVTAGKEVTIDLSKLVGEQKGAKTIAELTAKEYNGAPIYRVRSEYKNPIELKAKEGNQEKTVKPLLKELDCQWYQYNNARDLLDAQIDDENQRNGFNDWGPADEDNWDSLGTTIAPKDAGVYKLVVTYTDLNNDGTLYYAKEPAVLYYAVDPVKVRIVPKGEYKVLEGRDGYELLCEQHASSTYALLKKDSDSSAVVQGESVEPLWQVIETRQQEGSTEPAENPYNCYTYRNVNFEINDKVTYKLQGYGVGGLYYDDADERYYAYENSNYTCYDSKMVETGEADANGKKYVIRDDGTLLSDTADITVTPMGIKKLSLTVDADKWGVKTKVYDAKPYTDAQLIGDALTVTDETGAVITGDALAKLGIRYEGFLSEDEFGSYGETKDIQDVGKYTVYAFFWGNEEYAPLKSPENPSEEWNPNDWGVKLGTYQITPATLTLKAALEESYTAGVIAQDVLDQIPGNLTVEGCAEDDAWAFTEHRRWNDSWNREEYYMDAWDDAENITGPYFCIYEKGAKIPLTFDEQLTRDKEYVVRYDQENSNLLWYYNGTTGDCNYVISQDAVAEFTVVKGNSTIESVEYGSVESVAMKVKNDAKDSMKRTVTMQEGIAYTSIGLDGSTELEGNLAAFRIAAPAEYNGSIPSTAMYRNAIESKAVNGYIVDEDAYDDDGNRGFIVVFDAREGTKTFPIRWEDDYVETYTIDFDNAVKLGNLKEAVAPKSLAFNAPEKKLAVGESRQLDVKITKAQMGDIIYLGYKSDNESVLTVNANGYVTALKANSKANITVFPQHEVNGKVEPIPGAKTASVTISTTKVTAPKAVKVTAHGSGSVTATLNYDTPSDGYRREIYVVDNNNAKTAAVKKAADFEKLLAGTSEKTWKENQWKGTFAIAPLYLDGADEALNRRRNGYAAQLSGLMTKGAYTVYVRNICAAKELANGSVITNDAANESASGTAVSFKTLKSELTSLKLELNDQLAGIEKDEDSYNTYRIDLGKLAKGTAESTTSGWFYTMPKDDAAQSYDGEWIVLPLKEKADKDAYENPKLEYTLGRYNEETGRWEYSAKNDIASIDKKGKLKFTGMTGDDNTNRRLIVRVRDLQTGTTGYIYLYVMAEADSVAAVKKSVTLSVGQTQELGSLLSYKAGKQKLTYYPYADVDMSAVKAAIKTQKQEQYFKLNHNNELQAIAGGGKLTLELTDRNVAREVGKDKATAKVTFKSSELAGVKKIKAYDVINDSFGLTFTYAGGADAFLVEIADANKTIYSKKFMRGGYDYGRDIEWDLWANEEWDSKGNRVKDTYRIDSGQITNYVRLTKETQYTVKITALYDGLAAKKPATVKVKTTKVPAVGGYIGDDWYDDEPYNTIKHRGGMSIQVGEYDNGYNLNEGATSLNILSGNSYTLTAEVPNLGRVNDTLVWTVDNAKVATVKAAAGSYCITMKGVKPGDTILEVKSKIWGNRVVARYDIHVVAVGDAYRNSNRYYGDNEPEDYTKPSLNNGSDNAPSYLPLSVGDARKVTANQREYFSFIAPEAGRYQLNADGNVGSSIYLRKTSPSTGYGYDSLNLGWLKQGQEVTMYSQVTDANYNLSGNIAYYVEVALTQRVEEMGAGTQTVTGANKQEIFRFTAPEAGRYQFSLEDSGDGLQYLYLYRNEDDALQENTYYADDEGSTVECQLSGGESVWVRTGSYLWSGSEYTFTAEKVSQDIDLTEPAGVTVAANGKKYLTFTVEQDGFYTFSSTSATPGSSITTELQVNGRGEDTNYDSEFVFKWKLSAGDQLCLLVTNQDSSNDCTFTLTTEKTTFTGVTGAETAIADGAYYQFTAPTAGTYDFSRTGSGNVYLYETEDDAFFDNGRIGYVDDSSAERELAAGESVYMAAQLDGATGVKLFVEKISKELDLSAGVPVTVAAGKKAYVSFTAEEDAYYEFAAADGTEANANVAVSWEINGNENYENNGSTAQFSVRKDLKTGDTLRLIIENSGSTAYTFTVKAEKVTIETMPTESTVTLAANNVTKGYQYTATEAGLYQFHMESEEEQTALYLYDSMQALEDDESSRALVTATAQAVTDGSGDSGEGGGDTGDGGNTGGGDTGDGGNTGGGDTGDGGNTGGSDTGDGGNTDNGGAGEGEGTDENEAARATTKYVCDITILLQAGQTVYVNPRNASSTDNLAVTLTAEKKTVEMVTATESTVTIPAGEKVEMIYTALEDGIYNFGATGATDSVTIHMYTSYDGSDDASVWNTQLSSSNTGVTKQIVLLAGQTVVWTLTANTEQSVALTVIEDCPLKELQVDGSVEAECYGTADVFVFTAPEAGTYTFWSEGHSNTYGVLYSADQVQSANILEPNSNNEGNSLIKASYGGSYSNFAFTYELKAGQKVYLKARYYYSSYTGTFSVCAAAGERTF